MSEPTLTSVPGRTQPIPSLETRNSADTIPAPPLPGQHSGGLSAPHVREMPRRSDRRALPLTASLPASPPCPAVPPVYARRHGDGRLRTPRPPP